MVSVTSSSDLCKYCFADQTVNKPKTLKPNKPFTADPLEHICKECNRPFKIVRSKDVCHPCYTEEQDRQKEQMEEKLKLFEVSVWEQADGVRPSSTTVILDVDEEQASDNVCEKMGYTNVSKTEVSELVGPYFPGFIVSFSTLP